MSVSYDDARAWSNIDVLLKDQLLLKIVSTLECLVCSEVMHVPFLALCGHSFCYSCLNAWFETKLNCPTCRTDLEQPPVLNMQLKDVSKSLTDIIIETMEEGQHKHDLEEARQLVLDEYEASKSNLFGEAFTSALTLIDNSDGVPRCGNCHWEAHGSQCLHCGQRFRIPRDDAYYDLDDGDAYNEDDQEGEIYGIADEYDSNDSFVDTRNFDLINEDQAVDSNDDLLSSGESISLWGGFRGEGVTFSNAALDLDEDLEDVVERIHGRDVSSYIEVSSEEEVTRPKRSRIIDVDLDSD